MSAIRLRGGEAGRAQDCIYSWWQSSEIKWRKKNLQLT